MADPTGRPAAGEDGEKADNGAGPRTLPWGPRDSNAEGNGRRWALGGRKPHTGLYDMWGNSGP